MQLGRAGGALSGQVSNGKWTAELIADPAPYCTTNPAPQAGKYNFVLPGVDNSPTQPAGDGLASATVDSVGNVSCSGALADGTSFSAAAMITSQGQWPLYASFGGGKGMILGWVTFASNGDLVGALQWIKETQPTASYYPAGFTNYCQVIGSFYAVTNAVSALAFTSGEIVLTGGDLARTIAHQIAIGANGKIVDLTQSKSTFSVANSTGVLSGCVVDEQTGKTNAVKMIVLENQRVTRGFVLGSTQSGRAILSPAP
jgi:hypothetical protein